MPFGHFGSLYAVCDDRCGRSCKRLLMGGTVIGISFSGHSSGARVGGLVCTSLIAKRVLKLIPGRGC